MNEFVIGFVNGDGIYQELSFRGVSVEVATAMASGLLAAGFSQVNLSGKEDRAISILPGDTEVPGGTGGAGDSGASGGTGA